jgi:16S rRNA (cytidine1402-2'-O)-methyltransferase
MKLCSVLGIKKELVSYYEHNKRMSGERIVARLLGGESCALVTDAGMPAISDPGEDVVRLCREAGVKVSVVPGPCAAISALAMSGLHTARFTFEGFLSAVKNERKAELTALRGEMRTMIFYEAPHKLKSTLSDMAAAFGEDRQISLCRELTKLNEEVITMTLGEAVRYYSEKDPRGEYVLVVEGRSEAIKEENPLLSLSVEDHVQHYIDSGMAKMDAIKAAAKDRGVSKSVLYKELL